MVSACVDMHTPDLAADINISKGIPSSPLFNVI
jgi:hypothetical protein